MSTDHRYTIDAPELLTGQQRARDVVFTGVMWFIYAYLWLPAISLGAWLLGMNFAYEVLVRAGGISALNRVLFWFAVALAMIIATVSLWSLAERLRFRDRHRRQAQPPVTDLALQEFFKVDERTLAGLRDGRCLQLAFNEAGMLSAVAVTVPGARVGGPDDGASGGGRPAGRNLPETG
jgi:biofilm PGA synthesis protein PgaD